ncbi:MAG: phosphonate C-P lyase system protein PhnH [Dehalococcoidia bacterium]|nr:phosphonate C-P lyase system protein PhnH [Dehalococcoidia bacterium]
MQSIFAIQPALDPVFDTQRVFRVMLDALARPGDLKRVPVAAAGCPGNGYAAALLLTALDHETTFASAPFAGADAFTEFVRLRTDARLAAPSNADWVIADGASCPGDHVRALATGTLEFPHDSATLVVMARSLTADDGLVLTLRGPGVPGHRIVRVSGVNRDVIAARNDVVRAYPCGIDVLVIDEDGVVCGLPRSTRVEMS